MKVQLPIRSALLAAALTLSLAPLVPAAAQTAPASAAESASTGGVPAWGIASSEIAADPAIRFGTLPNGMRYAIMRHDSPKGEASVRFAIRVGVKDEADAEAGAAHFVEHMAFNGSKGIPEGKLLPMLERLGLAFGADTNAETGFDQTTYKLDLPNTRAETVDAALMMMREVAGNLTISPGAVERERGILLSEASVRNDQNRRRIADFLAAHLPGNRLGPRITALPDKIRAITPGQLKAFYQAHYRPDRATLVIVGAVDPADIEAKIRARFADWKPAGKAGAEYTGPVTPAQTTRFAAFSDPAIPELIAFDRAMPYEPARNTLEEDRRGLLESVAGRIIANRFQPIALQADSPVLGAQFAAQDIGRNASLYGLVVVARDGQWSRALALGEQELRRAYEHGFTPSEVDEAKANLLAALTNAAQQAESRRSAGIAGMIVSDSLSGTVPESPAQALARYRKVEASITPARLAEAFRKAWGGAPGLVHVSTKAPIADAEATLAARYAESARVAVAAPVDKAVAAFAYDSFGVPGKVVSDRTIADLGIRTVRFGNGLQLNLKRTDWEAGKVSFALNVGPGGQAMPPAKPGIAVAASILLPQDGLKAHDATELRKILAGRRVSLGLGVEEDALSVSATIPANDLDLQFKLLAARLSATAFRPETAAQWAPTAKTLGEALSAQPMQLWSLAQGYVLTGGDGRMGLPSPKALSAVTFEDMRAQIAPQLGEGAAALSLVGDFDPDQAIAMAARTLGALPKRPERALGKYSYPPLAFTAKGLTQLTHAGQADQGVVSISWPTNDDHDLRESLTRELLAAAMNLRALDLIREQLGATYTPQASSYDQPAYPGYGHITMAASSAPKDMALIAGAFRQIAGEMRDQPVGEDLLKRAREPMLAAYQRAERENDSWVNLVAVAQSEPARLDRRRQRIAVLQSLTPADLQAAARRFLDEAKAAEIRVVPAAAPAK